MKSLTMLFGLVIFLISQLNVEKANAQTTAQDLDPRFIIDLMQCAIAKFRDDDITLIDGSITTPALPSLPVFVDPDGKTLAPPPMLPSFTTKELLEFFLDQFSTHLSNCTDDNNIVLFIQPKITTEMTTDVSEATEMTTGVSETTESEQTTDIQSTIDPVQPPLQPPVQPPLQPPVQPVTPPPAQQPPAGITILVIFIRGLLLYPIIRFISINFGFFG